MDKIGDKVMLLELPNDIDSPEGTHFGHYVGDIGIITAVNRLSIWVYVEGRISTSNHTPDVAWYTGTYQNITRSLKIDSLLNE